MYGIEIYEDKDGNAPIADFIEDLNTKANTSKLHHFMKKTKKRRKGRLTKQNGTWQISWKGVNDMAVKTRKWDEIYNNLDALTQEDRDEIALKVKIIGQILEARKEKGLTQAELEEISGVKQTFIARLENNRMDPQLTTILKLLHPLGMTLAVVPLKEQPR